MLSSGVGIRAIIFVPCAFSCLFHRRLGRWKRQSAKQDLNQTRAKCNRFYFFDCLTHEGYVGITQEEISANLTNIIRDAAGVSKEVRADVAVGALTAEERSKWYEARQHMMKIDPENIQILNMIDSALFVVCLDDVSPETESKVAANMLHGLQRTFLIARNASNARYLSFPSATTAPRLVLSAQNTASRAHTLLCHSAYFICRI